MTIGHQAFDNLTQVPAVTFLRYNEGVGSILTFAEGFNHPFKGLSLFTTIGTQSTYLTGVTELTRDGTNPIVFNN